MKHGPIVSEVCRIRDKPPKKQGRAAQISRGA